jgi:predicted Zn-dependent protease
VAATQGSIYGNLASQLGQIGGGALLAHYSRDNEREADALGMEYMVKSGYSPEGMVGLMDVLQSLGKHKPSSIELMFATHPMSEERYQTAVQRANSTYKAAKDKPLYRERYMDNTARLRGQKAVVEEIQKGEEEIAKKNLSEADRHFRNALKSAPNDYTALVMMSKNQLMQKNWTVARQYANMAKKAYPQEPQANLLAGFAKLQLKKYDGAYQDFDAYEKRLPGNPTIVFFKGYAQEGMGQRRQAAQDYHRYLQVVQQGDYAQHAYRRLREWGYVR